MLDDFLDWIFAAVLTALFVLLVVAIGAQIVYVVTHG